MWTSSGDRKIVTWFQSPGGAQRWSAGPAIITLPSAGDTTTPASCGNCAVGIPEEIGEEPAEQRERAAARPRRRVRASAAAGTRAPAMNGYPARSIFMEDDGRRKAKAGRPRGSR